MQQDIHSQISSSKNQKCFSVCSLKPESIHIPWISPCFTKAHDYSWILHSKFQVLDTRSSTSGGQHFFFLSLAFWGFWDTSPLDTVCYTLNFKKLYRQNFWGVVFHYLHICGHFLPENFPLLETTFLNLVNSPSISRSYPNKFQALWQCQLINVACETAKCLHGIINIEFLRYWVKQIPLVINIFLHMFTFCYQLFSFKRGGRNGRECQCTESTVCHWL